MFSSFPIYFAFAGWLCTQLRNFTLPLEKDSSALAGIRVQDDPTDVRACPVCATDEPLTWYCWLCVLHLFTFLAEVKTVGSIQSLFLHNSGLKLSEGARKWAQRVNHELYIDDTKKNHSSFKVNNSLSCSHAGLYLHKLLLSSCGCKWGTLAAPACLALLLLWAGSMTNGGVRSTVLSEVSGLDQMSALQIFHIDTLLDKREITPELWSLVKDTCQAVDYTRKHSCHLFWTLG